MARQMTETACRIPEPSKHFLDSAKLMYLYFWFFFFSLMRYLFWFHLWAKNMIYQCPLLLIPPFLKIVSKAFFTDRQMILFLIPLAWRRTEDPREWRVKNLFISGFGVGDSILFFAPVLVHKYLLMRMFTVLWWREAGSKEVVLALWR